MKTVILNGARMTDRETAHRYLAELLDFPPYYGGNLDALADCLSEFCGGWEILLLHPEALCAQLGSYGEVMLEVFREFSQEDTFYTFRCMEEE
ncbi:MAG: barstar family protein [Clostridia bacterium]|nr:barstar family protein [Clostridia bacterium]